MFNYVDLILIILILFGVYVGWQKGFIIGILNLVLLAASFFAAFSFYLYIATFLSDEYGIEERWLFPLSFSGIFIITQLLIRLLSYQILKYIPNKTHQSTLNKSMGLFTGTVYGAMYAIIVSLLFLFFPFWDGLTSETKESTLANTLTTQITILDKSLAPELREEIKQSISRFNIEPETDETVMLQFKVENPSPNEKFEDQMLILVNKDRKRAGLNPLIKDVEIRVVARLHSKEMFQKGYFSHYSLENKSPFDRMKALKIEYRTAGENLALAQTVEIAHSGLMKSKGHRENILNAKFNSVGIGIMDGGIYGLMVTQNFRN
jgi:uncharacterized protein YkwD